MIGCPTERHSGAADRQSLPFYTEEEQVPTGVQDSIRIRGARVHNLKNISLSIPHNELTVITGVSGSGKSSLAFDTIYAEGQRRYVESLSAYARQFLERMEKPDVDDIDGIAPAVAIRQKNTTRNPRSTVATSTECYDFLRLLYARIGRTICPDYGREVRRDSVDEVAARVLALPEGSRWYVLFPCPSGRRNPRTADALRDRLFELRKKGFNRLFQSGRLFEFSTPESLLEIDFSKPLFVLVDRMAIRADLHQRLVDTVEICYREAGEVIFENAARAASASALQRKVSMQDLRPGVRRARADPVQLQLAGRRLPALPGFRQHHRFRHGPGDSGPVALARGGRGRTLDQAQVPVLARQFQKSRPRRAPPRAFFQLTAEERERVEEFVRSAFSSTWKPRNTSCTCASFSAVTAATRCARNARARACARKRCGCAWAATPSPTVARMNIAEAYQFFGALELTPGRNRHRRQGAGGNSPAPEVPQRRGAGIPDAGPPGFHAFRRRSPAHPIGHLARLAPGGRLLRAR